MTVYRSAVAGAPFVPVLLPGLAASCVSLIDIAHSSIQLAERPIPADDEGTHASHVVLPLCEGSPQCLMHGLADGVSGGRPAHSSPIDCHDPRRIKQLRAPAKGGSLRAVAEQAGSC